MADSVIARTERKVRLQSGRIVAKWRHVKATDELQQRRGSGDKRRHGAAGSGRGPAATRRALQHCERCGDRRRKRGARARRRRLWRATMRSGGDGGVDFSGDVGANAVRWRVVGPIDP
ncbi:hypothetical protein Scep_004015 [Stephania cephalantha]|uniref:Uncharacterized protein n=1 Tax=Stephania cephalantha TaxID=152367 RepID=A0AAP0KRQ0_9MAGN